MTSYEFLNTVTIRMTIQMCASFSLLGSFFLAFALAQGPTPTDKVVKQTAPTERYEPQVVPEPAKDPIERIVRTRVSARFNHPKSRPLDEETHAPAPPGLLVNRALLPALPSKFSAVIALGEIGSVQTFFSEDKTAIYRELIFRIDEPFKSTARGLKKGDSLTLISEGGSLILPDGRIVTYPVRGDGSPLVLGHRYVLFLHENRDISRFRIVTAWEVGPNQVLPTAVFSTAQEREEIMALDPPQFLTTVRNTVR